MKDKRKNKIFCFRKISRFLFEFRFWICENPLRQRQNFILFLFFFVLKIHSKLSSPNTYRTYLIFFSLFSYSLFFFLLLSLLSILLLFVMHSNKNFQQTLLCCFIIFFNNAFVSYLSLSYRFSLELFNYRIGKIFFFF